MSTPAYNPTSMPSRESQLAFFAHRYDDWRDRVSKPRPRGSVVEERMSRGDATLRVHPHETQG